MNITKKFLKMNEINVIVNDMIKKETYLQAIASRDMMILYFCTDLNVIDENGMIDATFENYDKYKEDGTINNVLSEIDENDLFLIDECYQHETGMNVIIKEFLIFLNKKIDKYGKGFNLQKAFDKLKDNFGNKNIN